MRQRNNIYRGVITEARDSYGKPGYVALAPWIFGQFPLVWRKGELDALKDGIRLAARFKLYDK